MDDSSREKVPLRIHTSAFDRTMGPEVKVGDVIRVHRAAVIYLIVVTGNVSVLHVHLCYPLVTGSNRV